MAKGGSTTQTQSLDPETMAQLRQMFGAAHAAGDAAMPGLSDASKTATANYGTAANAGNLGFGALSGDPNAIKSFMNPYTEGVVNAAHTAYGQARDATSSSINDQATQAGAFGGSRHGVAEGVALGQLGNGEASTIADLRHQGFNEAMGRAGGTANLGMGANAGLAGQGEYARQVAIDQNPALHRYGVLKDSVTGIPHGVSQTMKTPSNPWATILGAGSSLAGLFPGMGGALAGLFGKGGLTLPNGGPSPFPGFPTMPGL